MPMRFPAAFAAFVRALRKASPLPAIALALCIALGMAGCSTTEENPVPPSGEAAASLASIPSYDGTLVVEIHDGEPGFFESDLAAAREGGFERYSALDGLGRCGTAFALIGRETMPEAERGDISDVHPSGWHQEFYDFVDQEALYNRSHLIAHQLAGEDANERNLITGTRTMNSEGMLPFEETVGDYVRETGKHVLYRVTPLFQGDELVARGVQMEALSLEDGGEGVKFNVFVYNVEPGIEIDYATGESRLADTTSENENATDDAGEYVLNTNTRKFHSPSCPSVIDIRDGNRDDYEGSRNWLIERGYEPCGQCEP